MHTQNLYLTHTHISIHLTINMALNIANHTSIMLHHKSYHIIAYPNIHLIMFQHNPITISYHSIISYPSKAETSRSKIEAKPIKTYHHPRHQDHNHNLKPKQAHITNACTLQMHDSPSLILQQLSTNGIMHDLWMHVHSIKAIKP